MCARAQASCLDSDFLFLDSPDICCKRQRSHTNQLTAIALFTTQRQSRERKESKQTPITVRHEEGWGQSHLGTLCDHVLLASLTDKTRGSAQLSMGRMQEWVCEVMLSDLRSETFVELNSLVLVPVLSLGVPSVFLCSSEAFCPQMCHIAAGFLLSGWKQRGS